MNTKVVPNPEQKGWEADGTTPNGTPIYKWESGDSDGGSAESAVLQDREEDQQVVSKFTVTANPTQDGMGLTNIPNKLVVDVDEKRASFIAGSPNSLISDSSEPWDVDLQGSLNMKSLGFPYSDIQYTAYGLSNSAGSIRLDSAGFSIFSGTINAPDATFSGDVRSNTRFVVSGGGNFRKHDDFGGLSIHGSGGVAISTNANAQDRLTIDAAGDAEFTGAVSIGRPDAGVAKVRIKGNGTTSATWGLLVEKSDGTPNFTVKDNGDATFFGSVSAGTMRVRNNRVYDSGADGIGLYFTKSGNAILPTDNDGQLVDDGPDLGNTQRKFKDAYLSGSVKALRVIQDGSPVIDAKGLITTLSTLRNATKDETTLEGLRDSIGNAIGGLIEKYEAEIATMPAPEPEVSTMEIEA